MYYCTLDHLPIYVQKVKGVSSTPNGVRTLPIIVNQIPFAIGCGKLGRYVHPQLSRDLLTIGKSTS